ncbi:hypothetical protein [Sutcliffiella horikoshii]|uniref:hypothetical protein n=1 Tax=Sutcliffiella horikoshii TaxID=79883 RepID=UPI001F2B5C2B|nr:hypothetical protein [Sutcliffiella horikoshii]MCG1020150.1 hypothetical protein [Sutcliffiella horikoshii]
MGSVFVDRSKDCGFCKKRSRANNCICDKIEDLVGEIVTIRTRSGNDFVDVEIKAFDPKTCCVTLLQDGMITPMRMPSEVTHICCEDIESITRELMKRKLRY